MKTLLKNFSSSFGKSSFEESPYENNKPRNILTTVKSIIAEKKNPALTRLRISRQQTGTRGLENPEAVINTLVAAWDELTDELN